MSADHAPRLCWVVLTMGNRPTSLELALRSLLEDDGSAHVLLVANGSGGAPFVHDRLQTLELADNLGVPGGRDAGLRATNAEIVGFLDDDAVLERGATEAVRRAFEADDRIGAVSMRLVDERGETQRRHIPRPGAARPDIGGDVALFLGGASALRRAAYDESGGYDTDLFYGHEELELTWRMVDRGWRIRYLPEARVFHPRTEISRHADGWHLTGRNRVWIARRTLPWPIALAHTLVWLVVGTARAPSGSCRHAYLSGWRSGWSGPHDRDPIRWRTVWRLTRLGRPPVI